jgi:hypothetical protein
MQISSSDIHKAYEESGSGCDLGGMTRSLIFFVWFYLYLWLGVDVRLIYNSGAIANFPIFYRDWQFFYQVTSYPSGPVEYLSAFLSQFFYYSWAGAIVITLQAWLIWAVGRYFLKAINLSYLRWLCFILPILLLALYAQYTFALVTTTTLLAAILFVCLYLKFISENKLFRLMTFLTLSVILYYISGGSYLLFAALCAAYELFFKRRWQIGILYLLIAAAVPYAEGVSLFGINVIDAFSKLLPFGGKGFSYQARHGTVIIVYILYIFLPVIAFISGFWKILASSFIQSSNQSNASFEAKPGSIFSRLQTSMSSWYRRHNKLRWGIESLILFGVTVATVFFFYDNKLKTMFETDYYASHRMWPEVLESASRYPDDFFIVYEVNKALFHTGRLGYDMFRYPQHADALFLTAKGLEFTYWKKFDLYIDIGLMNLAENALTECLVGLGERPITLQRLALVNMAKGNIDAAKIYLGAVSKTLFYADWANDYIERLQSDPNLSKDKQIQLLRSVMLGQDYGFFTFSFEKMLLQLLEKNRQNRMAFEYLMAWYLLNRQLDKFVQNFERLNDFDYSEIPPLYEEALLIYAYGTGEPVNLYGRQISRESHQRIEDFTRTFNNYKRNKAAAFNELAQKYGDSYFFFYIYGFSGTKG